MDHLIECTCGHAIANHAADGCQGARMRPCPCPLTESQVLDLALIAARTHYDTIPQPARRH
jgi:hypothetical protein